MVILRGGGSSFFNIAIKGGAIKNCLEIWQVLGGGGSLKSFLMFSFAFKF